MKLIPKKSATISLTVTLYFLMFCGFNCTFAFTESENLQFSDGASYRGAVSLQEKEIEKPPGVSHSTGPSFDLSPPRNVTALNDGYAYLHCIVHNKGNKTVSWIRENDLHILTVNTYTYTADDRFKVIHPVDSNSWTLKINSVQPRDSGRYDCQVNTHPTDPITFSVWLKVFVPTSKILGTTERYVDRGSTINLTCIINHNPEPATETFWYHNNKIINYDSRDSRVSVITDRGILTKTILLIHDASDAATGTYSCVPSPSSTSSVRIHILNGETHAAIQTNGALMRTCMLLFPLQILSVILRYKLVLLL